MGHTTRVVQLPPNGFLNSVVQLLIYTLILATTFLLAEEIGIRGYLLPKLLSLGRKRALLLSGLIWATWRMPLIYLTPLLPIGHPVIGLPLFYAVVVVGSLFYGYLRLATGSVWPSVDPDDERVVGRILARAGRVTIVMPPPTTSQKGSAC